MVPKIRIGRNNRHKQSHLPSTSLSIFLHRIHLWLNTVLFSDNNFHFSVVSICFFHLLVILFLNFATELQSSQSRQKCCRMFWFWVWAFSSSLKIKTFETTGPRSKRAGKTNWVCCWLTVLCWAAVKFIIF